MTAEEIINLIYDFKSLIICYCVIQVLVIVILVSTIYIMVYINKHNYEKYDIITTIKKTERKNKNESI